MYYGENHMVLPTWAPEDPDTITESVSVSVLTPIVNIGRWQGYEKYDADADLAEAYYGFTTTVDVECTFTECRDDDGSRCAVPDHIHLMDQVDNEVHGIDPDADFIIL